MAGDPLAKDDLAVKQDWVRMKRKVNHLSDLHPLTLNIETIFNLPLDIEVRDEDYE